MKTTQAIVIILSLASTALISSCGDDHHLGKGLPHSHVAPHGGTLIECGDHQYNLEVVHDSASGDLEIYVLDGHASKPIRIKQESIEVTIAADGAEAKKVFGLPAIADSQQEKTVGDTDFFRAKEALPGTKKFKGTIKNVTIQGTLFEDMPFQYPPEKHSHK
ncbi:MAG: hypothetical protein VB980_02320 [Opitutales bacterium]|jgi:hypothetical protein